MLLAVGEGGSPGPAAITANRPSRWHQGVGGTELVIISHGEFVASLGPLKARWERQGLAVAVVDVEDVYDEFSYGAKTPHAIRDFLRRAWAGERPPRYVLLVGDASFDPRNYLGLGRSDFVPTKLVEAGLLETASDDWLADFDEDGVPELAVGRLPVSSAAEAARAVAKLVGYDGGAGSGGVVLVADANEGFGFEGASTRLREPVPATRAVEEIWAGQDGEEAARGALLASLNAGPALVNYIGHGSVEAWRGNLLTSEDALGLTNGGRLPIVVAMTCLNGFFQDLYTYSLAEALLNAERGGAVAVWASSSLELPQGQAVMNRVLLGHLLQDKLTLGEAVRKAKAAVSDRDGRRTWILFGDPTIRLK